MKTLLCGDLHIGINESDENFLKYQKESLEWIIEEVKKSEINEVILLGDLFHNRKAVSLHAMKLAEWFLSAIKPKLSVLCLGNHDCHFKNTNDLNSPMHFVNTNIIPNPALHVNDKSLCVSWINESNLAEVIEAIKKTKAKFLFGHFDLAGFKLMKGINSLHDQIDRESLTKFKHVISGHFHSFSQKENITYIGAPYEMNWGDLREQKLIGVLDDKTGKLTFLENPNYYHIEVQINGDDYLTINIDSLILKNVRLFINCEQTIPMNKKIQEMTDKIINLDIIDNFMVESITLDSTVNYNGSVIELWNEYVETEELDNKEDIIRIFEEEYKKVMMR